MLLILVVLKLICCILKKKCIYLLIDLFFAFTNGFLIMFRIEHLNRHQKKKRKKWNYLHKKRLISNFSIGDWLFILKSYKIYLLLQNGDGKTFFGGFWFKYAHFHSHLMHQKKTHNRKITHQTLNFLSNQLNTHIFFTLILQFSPIRFVWWYILHSILPFFTLYLLIYLFFCKY